MAFNYFVSVVRLGSNLDKVDCFSGFSNCVFSSGGSCEVVVVFRRAANYYKRTTEPRFSGWRQRGPIFVINIG